MESQISKAELERGQASKALVPKKAEIATYAEIASTALRNLNFRTKKEIVMCVIDKVVGTKAELTVSGFIPITNINVFTSYRHRRSPKRRQINSL